MELGAPDHAPGSSSGGATTTMEASHGGSGSVKIPVDKAAPFVTAAITAKSIRSSLHYLWGRWGLAGAGVSIHRQPVVVAFPGDVLQQSDVVGEPRQQRGPLVCSGDRAIAGLAVQHGQ